MRFLGIPVPRAMPWADMSFPLRGGIPDRATSRPARRVSAGPLGRRVRVLRISDSGFRILVAPAGRSSSFLILKLNLAADALSCFNVDQRSTPSTGAIAVAGDRISCVGFSCKFDNSASPRFGETLSGRHMILKDKLQMLMGRHGLNGQKLARSSQVSDSEISRILQGKSRPGLDNAFRIARSVGVTLDYLADDSLDAEPSVPADNLSPEERKILAVVQKIGFGEVLTILENIRFLGYEVAMSRLVGGKPIIEIDKEPPDIRPAVTQPAVAVSAPARPSSATA